MKKVKDQLAADLECSKKENEELKKRLITLTCERDALRQTITENQELQDEMTDAIILEHTRGFKKALRQVSYILNVCTEGVNFDIRKDVYQGELVPIDVIPAGSFPDDEPAGTPTEAMATEEAARIETPEGNSGAFGRSYSASQDSLDLLGMVRSWDMPEHSAIRPRTLGPPALISFRPSGFIYRPSRIHPRSSGLPSTKFGIRHSAIWPPSSPGPRIIILTRALWEQLFSSEHVQPTSLPYTVTRNKLHECIFAKGALLDHPASNIDKDQVDEKSVPPRTILNLAGP
ncbi:hypothetical protein LR48_Vigan10g257700 [Vigna angularis]|uniref:Uncharacterized protein n=1 Tax=Phaseolus angularis TaxID=3914 RepID=A0A0L9VNP8_PHAAN|nr:hypothetical protein LR48_Vigan10g257700 [Vigna angularis]